MPEILSSLLVVRSPATRIGLMQALAIIGAESACGDGYAQAFTRC